MLGREQIANSRTGQNFCKGTEITKNDLSLHEAQGSNQQSKIRLLSSKKSVNLFSKGHKTKSKSGRSLDKANKVLLSQSGQLRKAPEQNLGDQDDSSLVTEESQSMINLNLEECSPKIRPTSGSSPNSRNSTRKFSLKTAAKNQTCEKSPLDAATKKTATTNANTTMSRTLFQQVSHGK